MDKTLLLIIFPAMAIAAVALAKGIPSLRSTLRTEEMANFPLAAGGGTVDIAEPGDLILSLLGILGSRDFARASFVLRDAAGQVVPSRLILMRSSKTTLGGETTLSVRRFAVSAPGRYRLEVTGHDPGSVAANSRLVLTRPRRVALFLRVIWVVAAALALLASIVFSAVTVFAQPAPAAVSVPAAGSPARAAILNAARSALAIPADGKSRFKVFHLKTAASWAYFEGNEIVQVDGPEWQETDLTAKALLQQESGQWRVRAIWSLPTNERTSLQEFERQVRDYRERSRVPAGIFP